MKHKEFTLIEAFTLIELLIVLIVISIFATISVFSLLDSKMEQEYRLVTGEGFGSDERRRENLKDFIQRNESFRKEMVRKYGHWEGVTNVNPNEPQPTVTTNIVSQEDNEQEPTRPNNRERILETEIEKLRQQIANSTENTRPYEYQIEEKRDAYGWKYTIVRNGKEVFTAKNKSECENVLRLIQEGFNNGLEIGKERKE